MVKPIVVGISEIRFVQRPERMVTYGLGSCVAIVIYAREAAVGGMAHVMLPLAFNPEDQATPGKFADTAVANMVERMESKGIRVSDLTAKLAGGADMFAGRFKGTGRRIGARNILAARKVLDHFGVHLAAQDVGGTSGRSAEFDSSSGVMMVRTLMGGVKQL